MRSEPALPEGFMFEELGADVVSGAVGCHGEVTDNGFDWFNQALAPRQLKVKYRQQQVSDFYSECVWYFVRLNQS